MWEYQLIFGFKSALSTHSSSFTVTWRSGCHAATIPVSLEEVGENSPEFTSIILMWVCIGPDHPVSSNQHFSPRTIFYQAGFI